MASKRVRTSRNAAKVAVLLLIMTAVSACSNLRRMEKQLSPGDREFVAQVRYIINRAERKRYVSIPPEERPAFRRDFWKRRDPSPETDRNEYREAYYQRVAMANRLFRSEGREGWLTERGRVFVLLGEPDRRDVYPTGYSFYEPPVEVWHYGFFPIIFVDRFKQGKYEMMQANAYYLNALTKAQIVLNLPQEGLAQTEMDFILKPKAAGKGKLNLHMVVPYKLLIFSKAGEYYKAGLVVEATLKKQDETEVWTGKKSYSLSVKEEQLGDLAAGYKIDMAADTDLAGTFILTVRVSNREEEKVAEKSMKIRIR